MKNLVIVESPSKAKTIQKYLGADFQVTSCMGHIRDLPKRLGVNIEKDFEPEYVVDEKKRALVAELRKQSRAAELVWLASDEDREGEAIAWHLADELEIPPAKIRRIVFHEITKPAILRAVKEPRGIDQNLVDAQQARRVLDRLLGYDLSPVLWSKIKAGLSAGRVQSVAVRLVVEREREISAFTSTSAFKVTAEFDVDGKKLVAELPHRFATEEEARAFLEKCIGATFSVQDLATKPSLRNPSAPFTTSTLQQEASRKLGYSLTRTMKLAQDLYEGGMITYMRTDSVNLSELAIEAAKQQITASYGAEYSNPKVYTNKVASAQEAHEAIRPTDFAVRGAGATEAHQRLYELIWKRAIASQMSAMRLEITTAKISISTMSDMLVANGEVVVFEGFNKVYSESTDEDTEDDHRKMLPPLRVGQMLNFQLMKAAERFDKPAPRYTEASLVKKLEELGIGRPSTYAPTVATIQTREYVVKEDRDGWQRDVRTLTMQHGAIMRTVTAENTGAERNKLFPTDLGMLTTDFLIKYFDEIMDYSFTATVEKQFDEIAEGDLPWTEMIRTFYGPFHKHVTSAKENAQREQGERLVGVDPTSGKNVYARLGRYGPIVQIGEADDTEKRQKGLTGGLSIASITLSEALELFRFPRNIGDFEGSKMDVKLGRFGPYIEHAGAFYSIPKEDDPATITADRGIEVIQARRKVLQERTIKEFAQDPTVKILKGRWGPFIVVGKQNVRIPKGTEAETLTLEECLQLAAQQAPAPAKKASKKATTATSEKPAAKKPAAKKPAAKKPAAKKSAAKKSAAKKTSAK
ncbi:MAG: type I DNA topoisomerase [Candidatus Kapabacteria bacterium]|nr:type I DNA topoisomerase [Candidatus Kapabacteria bacterium]